jgi:hypothetical protein
MNGRDAMAKRTRLVVGAMLVGVVGCSGKGLIARDAIGGAGPKVRFLIQLPTVESRDSVQA